MPYRVAFLGFTDFERHALTAYFRLAQQRRPAYAHVATLTDADFLVADADHSPSVQLVLATERLAETVFIGAQAPEGCAASMQRPIDVLHVMRELDGIVAQRNPALSLGDDAGTPTTITQLMHRRAEEAPQPMAAVLLGDLPFSQPVPDGDVAALPSVAAAPQPAETAPDAAPAHGPDVDLDQPFEPAPHPAPATAQAPSPAPENALTLRDLPIPSGDVGPVVPPNDLFFPEAEGLVGHESALPVPGRWKDTLTLPRRPPLRPEPPVLRDLPVLHDLPVLDEIALPPAATPSWPAAPASPARASAPAVAPSPAATAVVAPATPPAAPPVARPGVRAPTQPASAPPLTPAAPLRAAPTLAALAVKSTKPPRVPKVALLPGTPRALLVDDSAIAQLFLEKRLERWAIHSDLASNSQAALALLAQHSYDLVFLDVELGPESEFDGLALCRQIKQTPSWMQALVVMVSAHHSELDRVRGALVGCDAYLGKPLDEAELQRLLLRQGLSLAAPAVDASRA